MKTKPLSQSPMGGYPFFGFLARKDLTDGGTVVFENEFSATRQTPNQQLPKPDLEWFTFIRRQTESNLKNQNSNS